MDKLQHDIRSAFVIIIMFAYLQEDRTEEKNLFLGGLDVVNTRRDVFQV